MNLFSRVMQSFILIVMSLVFMTATAATTTSTTLSPENAKNKVIYDILAKYFEPIRHPATHNRSIDVIGFYCFGYGNPSSLTQDCTLITKEKSVYIEGQNLRAFFDALIAVGISEQTAMKNLENGLRCEHGVYEHAERPDEEYFACEVRLKLPL